MGHSLAASSTDRSIKSVSNFTAGAEAVGEALMLLLFATVGAGAVPFSALWGIHWLLTQLTEPRNLFYTLLQVLRQWEEL